MSQSPLLVLFDLDGTLVDPAGSITGGISRALATVGFPAPPGPVLRRMVGPALVDALQSIAGVPEELIPRVVELYRDEYVNTGMQQSVVYPGIGELLANLREEGMLLAVATQKPEWLAERLLAAKGIAGWFDSVHGSPRDEVAGGALDGKKQIVAAALDALEGRYRRVVMVGDRRHDVEGAAASGVDCIGVRWGFAAPEELEEAGAVGVVEDAGELRTALHSLLRSPETAG